MVGSPVTSNKDENGGSTYTEHDQLSEARGKLKKKKGGYL